VCSNVLKTKLWKLALTRTPDPIRPTGVTSWGFSLGREISGGDVSRGGYLMLPICAGHTAGRTFIVREGRNDA